MNLEVHFSSKKDDRETDDILWRQYDAKYHFDVDLAAGQLNHKTAPFFGSDSLWEKDALAVDWSEWGSTGWCNPPYTRGVQSKFIKKAVEQTYTGFTTVMLLPARTDTKSFHRFIWDKKLNRPREGIEVHFLEGRQKFKGAQYAAPFPSMIVIFHGKIDSIGL